MKIKETELGSGVATAGATAMPAPWRSKLMGLRLESSKSTFERSMPLDPGDSPLRVRTARVPMFEAPGPGPSRVSAVNVIEPEVLSIVPGRKNVGRQKTEKIPPL